jgi:hypothetical protein
VPGSVLCQAASSKGPRHAPNPCCWSVSLLSMNQRQWDDHRDSAKGSWVSGKAGLTLCSRTCCSQQEQKLSQLLSSTVRESCNKEELWDGPNQCDHLCGDQGQAQAQPDCVSSQPGPQWEHQEPCVLFQHFMCPSVKQEGRISN